MYTDVFLQDPTQSTPMSFLGLLEDSSTYVAADAQLRPTPSHTVKHTYEHEQVYIAL